MTDKSEDQVIYVCSCERNPTRIATIYEICSRCKQPITAYIPHSQYLALKSDLATAVEALQNIHIHRGGILDEELFLKTEQFSRIAQEALGKIGGVIKDKEPFDPLREPYKNHQEPTEHSKSNYKRLDAMGAPRPEPKLFGYFFPHEDDRGYTQFWTTDPRKMPSQYINYTPKNVKHVVCYELPLPEIHEPTQATSEHSKPEYLELDMSNPDKKPFQQQPMRWFACFDCCHMAWVSFMKDQEAKPMCGDCNKVLSEIVPKPQATSELDLLEKLEEWLNRMNTEYGEDYVNSGSLYTEVLAKIDSLKSGDK